MGMRRRVEAWRILSVRFRAGLGGAWMQAKLLEFFAQGKSG